MVIKNKVIKNASWIIACKVAQSILILFIGMFTARYLGPANYGLISYASSIVAFVLPIMQLGFNSTLVQEIISTPDKEGTILGTSLVCNIVSAFFSIVGVTAFAYIANPNEPETVIVCFLYSLSLLFQASEMIQYWFQAKYLSKYPSIVAFVAYVITSSYKIFLLVTEKNIRWFALTHVIEAFLVSVLLMIIYRMLSIQTLHFSFPFAKEMFSRSKYYIISGIMVSVFQQTDRIMLKIIQDETDTGYYSSAITCIGITAFVFTAIVESARPSILESKKASQTDFEKKVVLLFSMITYLSLAQSVMMTMFAKPLILVLFGESYLPAVPVLRTAVWYSTFGYYGVVRNVWILGEQKQKYLWLINLVGALTNVILNIILIPYWGAIGAAIASLVTQIVSNFVLSFIIRDIRLCGFLMLKSLNPKILLEAYKHIKKES